MRRAPKPPRLRLALALALVAASLAGAAPSAQAAPRMELALQDDPIFLHRDYYDRDQALAQARELGITRLRVSLGWAATLGPQADDRTQPRPLVYDFSRFDDLIDAAAGFGIRLQLNLIPPAPAWATGDRKLGVNRPNPALYARFVRAAAEHFKGRVDRYAVWNEPNHVGWLTPQSTAASQYRQLYLQAYKQIKRVDRSAQVLIGELVPYKNGSRSSAPLLFLRQLTCTRTASGFPGLRGYRMRKRGRCTPLRADGLAHHPYEYQGPPERTYPGSDNVTIGTLGRMTSTLAELRRLGALATPKRRVLPVFITEFGYFGQGRNSHPDVRRASYLRRAYQIAQRNPMVQQMTQYLLVRPPRRYTGSYFDMSIVLPNGTPLAPFKELSRWSRSAARRGQITTPGSPISLPPRPPGA
jgi:hypothetical protein